MPDKKPTTNKQTPLHTIRVGDAVSEIYARTSNSGLRYKCYALSHEFESGSGRQTRGAVFFPSMAKNLIEVIRLTVAWIRETDQADADDDHHTDSH